MDWIKVFESPEAARNVLLNARPQLVVIGDKRICLVFQNETLFAIEDKCSHNGESLSKGTVNYLGEVICPWHGYRFNLKTGRESGERSHDLVIYPVKENEEGVFIGI
ncbi:MAG TPA: Rieske 2Fe-2S domain-containing protein [Cyclobacteriaceae bacterium]